MKGVDASSRSKTRKGVAPHPYFVARHAEHVKLMFEVSWMPALAGISSALQDVDQTDMETTNLCISAFRCSIRLGEWMRSFDNQIFLGAFVFVKFNPFCRFSLRPVVGAQCFPFHAHQIHALHVHE